MGRLAPLLLLLALLTLAPQAPLRAAEVATPASVAPRTTEFVYEAIVEIGAPVEVGATPRHRRRPGAGPTADPVFPDKISAIPLRRARLPKASSQTSYAAL